MLRSFLIGANLVMGFILFLRCVARSDEDMKIERQFYADVIRYNWEYPYIESCPPDLHWSNFGDGLQGAYGYAVRQYELRGGEVPRDEGVERDRYIKTSLIERVLFRLSLLPG